MGRRKEIAGKDNGESVVIKKYANRRLYNTQTSSYVTLEDLAGMVRDRSEFVVQDARTGEDITRAVLTQIIVEEEAKGQHLLPVPFLRRLISLYGDNLQYLVPRYLDVSMENFSRNQEEMRQYLQNALGGFFPFGQIETMSQQNMALLKQAADLFSSFPFSPDSVHPPGQEKASSPKHDEEEAAKKIHQLEQKMEELRRELHILSRKTQETKPD